MARRVRFKKIRILLSVLGGILFGCALGGAVVVILATQFFGYKVLAVQSPSMEPALNKGDLVIIKDTNPIKLKEGDIIYFTGDDGLPEIHRILTVNKFTINATTKEGKFVGSRTDFKFVTKGDANPASDGNELRPSQIHGKLWFSIGGLGSLASGGGIQVLLLGIAAFIGVLWIAVELGPKLGGKKKDGPGDAARTDRDDPVDWSPESAIMQQPLAPPPAPSQPAAPAQPRENASGDASPGGSG